MSPPGSRQFKATCRVVEYDHHPGGGVHWRGEYGGDYGGWETWDLVAVDGGSSVTVEMAVLPGGGPLTRPF